MIQNGVHGRIEVRDDLTRLPTSSVVSEFRVTDPLLLLCFGDVHFPRTRWG